MKILEALGAAVIYLVVSAGIAFLAAGLAYYGLQFAHESDSQIPTFSYWGLYWLILIIRVVIPTRSSSD